MQVTLALLMFRHELERMREASSSPSKEDIERQQLAAQQQADAELAKAQERTNRMLEVRQVPAVLQEQSTPSMQDST